VYSLLYTDSSQHSTIENILPLFFCKRTSFIARSEALLWFLVPKSYTALLGPNSSLHQCQTCDGQQQPSSTRHGVRNLPAFPENPRLRITGCWHRRKPCVILANTTNPPLTVRMSHAVQSEAVPL